MKNLTNDEINRILAKFEGLEDAGFYVATPKYTENLNATARVWEKLNCTPCFHNESENLDMLPWLCSLGFEGLDFVQSEWCKTIQEAASHATALCILELLKEKDNE